MEEQVMKLVIDLHRSTYRQGPGGDSETELAMMLAGLDCSRPLKIADIGCGTGASATLLARKLDAEITAVDFLPEFLAELRERAEKLGVSDRITALQCSMDALPFAEEQFDVIWSEGAVYNIGFEAGISAWNRFLKPGGKLAVSEITWLTAERPHEIESYWQKEYPQIDTASAKFRILEQNGYSPLGYFVLPAHCWSENYYRPLQDRFAAFLERNGNSSTAKAVVEAEEQEIELHHRYASCCSYGFYVVRKVSGVSGS
jgi:cyclopropane fatty-acyl-phospholipid synthase-like methyltransferase